MRIQEHARADAVALGRLLAAERERDAARADADRLAAAARAVEDIIPYSLANDPEFGPAFYALHGARTAHDALTAEETQ